jgi:hypothetical protein
MKAYRVINEITEERRLVVAEVESELKLNENELAEELCEVEEACIGGFDVWEKDENETTAPDYITREGQTIRVGSPIVWDELDVEKTNTLMEKNGDCPFAEWDFSLWLGTFWDGSNWKLVTVEK